MITPIFKEIKNYIDADIIPFHTPGHKMGRALHADFKEALASFDITEIPGTDYLHQPVGIIKEAQDLAAVAFGSERTFFLVNGSTCGIYAMIHAICNPGDKLIVSRDCHGSVINGMMLAGVRPVYVMPEYDSDFCISTGIAPDRLIQTLDNNREAKGVLVTRPNYYGICSDIERISDIVHSYGMVLAVDEAHGAHLKFSKRLPVCAMDAGADICVQSAHKTLPALTQGAYLHVGSDSIDIYRLEYFLELFQSTSPSYMILTSLDIAREIMSTKGQNLLEKLIDDIEFNISGFTGKSIRFTGDSTFASYKADTTRITANVRNLLISGYEAEKILREKYKIQVEMSDIYNIVSIATIADTSETIERLFFGLSELDSIYRGENPIERNQSNFRLYNNESSQQMDLSTVMQAKCENIALRNAVGRVSRGIVAPYPPGIPVLCPGELISQDSVDYLFNIVNAGGKVNGINENLEINVI